MRERPLISILMLTHNAPRYVLETVTTVRKFTDKGAELIIVDNKSRFKTRALLFALWATRRIDRVKFLNWNSMFAAGNNICSTLADPAAKYYLLMNSDIRVSDPDWLRTLLEHHDESGGITAYGICKNPLRVDGYAFLIDAALYNKYKLDENFQWFWGITKLQAQVRGEGKVITGLINHEKYLHHYGGKSKNKTTTKQAKGMDIKRSEVVSWFAALEQNPVRVIDLSA